MLVLRTGINIVLSLLFKFSSTHHCSEIILNYDASLLDERRENRMQNLEKETKTH